MAHRRKNSHPLCKQKRISTVVEFLAAAKSKQEQLGLNDEIDDDEDPSPKTNNASDSSQRDQLSGEGQADTLEAVRKRIDLPDDLFRDFVALKSATNLDTADLMRKLIKDLNTGLQQNRKADEPEKESRDRSDAEKLSEYYREAEQRYLLKDEGQRETTHRTSGQSFDLRALRAEYFQNGMENVQSGMTGQKYTYLFDGHEGKEGLDGNERKNSTDSSESEEYRGQEFQSGEGNIDGSKKNRKNQKDDDGEDRGPPPPYPYPAVPGGIPYLPSALPGMVPIGSIPEGFPMLGQGPMLQPNMSPEALQLMNSPQTNPMISGGITENDNMAPNSKYSPGDNDADDRSANPDSADEPISQLWNPMQAKRTFFKSVNPKKKNADKKKMILIAENTSNHGVYTSVLKLPWSRRTRTPKADVGHPQALATDAATKKQMIRQELQEQQVQGQMMPPPQPHGAVAQQPHPSYVFVPYPAVSLPNSQGVFIPNTSLPGITSPVPMETQPATSQSMMMVYPNQNLTGTGKPVRKRGRPPKTPTMAKMLADSSKKMKYEASLPTFIQNFSPCPTPAAIVLNVNNMLNTGNAVTATNSINTAPAHNPEMSSNQTVTTQIVKEESKESKEFCSTSEALTKSVEETNLASNSRKIKQESDLEYSVKAEVDDIDEAEINNSPNNESTGDSKDDDGEVKMVTTTTMANAATGALYQEMILSSKSFVNARARGRKQSTNELLKSKSEAQNFLCTSFRLRSLSGNKKEKKPAQYVPGMKRRGRPPKKRLENMFEGQMVEVSQERLESINDNISQKSVYHSEKIRGAKFKHAAHEAEVEDDTKGSGPNEVPSAICRPVSPTGSNSSDDQLLVNEMFQQLFHCKLCNEIVPVDKKDSHWLIHTKRGSNICSCGGMFQKYLCRETEDSEPVRMIKCDFCERVQPVQRDQTSQSKASSNNVDSLSVSCIECGEKFPSYNNLQQHIAVAHPNTATQYQSSQFLHVLSQKAFPEKSQKSTAQNQGSEKIYECQESTCKKRYATKMDLYAHVQRRHGGNQQVYCIYEGCEKKFPNDVHLQEHIQFKHLNTISIKSYKCSWTGCEEEFATERQLKIHLLVHQDEKPLKCAICDNRFRQKSALIWHLKKHHPEVNYESSQDSIDDQDEEESQ
ncbi:hypothetical protein FSP39_005737 [Pinctada imbricata]|uniref:C2H2-type domain-containing protein n=1 Tax=Pinctada imbricata TaxID=66713 RepID=A0AA89C252_PINIB|nr:hypothetical protein FSP39_005737 [Pinctada imbricata]